MISLEIMNFHIYLLRCFKQPFFLFLIVQIITQTLYQYFHLFSDNTIPHHHYKHAHQLLAEQFPNARIFACISPLLEYFHTRSREHDTKNLYAHFHGNRMEVFAFEKGKLLLTNTFPCKHTSDKVYYMLYIWQQLGFSQEKDQLWLAGNIEAQGELIPELNKFIRNVKEFPKKENLSFDLQTLMICE